MRESTDNEEWRVSPIKNVGENYLLTVLFYIENIRKMSTKNLKSKTPEKPLENLWKTSEKPLKNLWFLVFEHIRNMATRVRFSKTSTFFVYFRCYFYLSVQKAKKRMIKNIHIVQIRTFRFKWCKIRKSPCASDLDKNINSWQNKKKSADWFVTQFDSWVPSYNYFLVLENSVFTNKNSWQLIFYQKEKSEKKSYYEKKRSGKDENLKLIFFNTM